MFNIKNKKDILSVFFINSKYVLVLYKKGRELDFSDIPEEEKANILCERFIVEEEDKESLEDIKKIDYVYNLLLNSMCRYEDDLYPNLEGKLHLYGYEMKVKNHTQIVTLNPFIKDGLLRIPVKSFIDVKDDLSEKEKKQPKYEKYYGVRNSIRFIRSDEYAKKELYIHGSRKKGILNYDDLVFPEIRKELKSTKRDNTKVELLNRFISDFNEKFYEKEKVAKISLKKYRCKTKDLTSIKKVMDKKISEFENMKNVVLYILDEGISDDERKGYKIFEEELRKIYPNITVVREEKFQPSNLYIVLHHNREYYKSKKQEDPYKKIDSEVIKQSITWEDLIKHVKETGKDKLDSKIMHVLNELYVKRELSNRKIERWKFNNYKFYIYIKFKDEQKIKERQCYMEIDENGNLTINTENEDIDLKYRKHTLSITGKSGSLVIVDNGQCMNKIVRTEMFAVAGLDEEDRKEQRDRSVVKENEKTLSKDRDVYYEKGTISPYVGKSVLEIDGLFCYIIGYSSSSIQQVVTKNCGIYAIEPVNYGGEINKEIIEMLEDSYVRSNSAESVRPYPIKYMMEYLRKKYPDDSKKLYL